MKVTRDGKEKDVEDRRSVDSMDVDDYPDDMDVFGGEDQDSDDGSGAPLRRGKETTRVASRKTTSRAAKGAATKAKSKPSTSRGRTKKLVSSPGFAYSRCLYGHGSLQLV